MPGIFLKIDGVQGDSKDDEHSGWIEVLSYQFKTNDFRSDDGKERWVNTDLKVNAEGVRVEIRKEGLAAHKLYLASTGTEQISGTGILVEEYVNSGEQISGHRYRLPDVKVVGYREGMAIDGIDRPVTVKVDLEFTQTPNAHVYSKSRLLGNRGIR